MIRAAGALAGAAAVLMVPMLLGGYNLRVLDLALVSAIAVIGLCFAFGYAGLIHLGQAAFVGVGAYGAALLTTRMGWDFWFAMPVAAMAGAVLAILVGWPMMRLRGHYLALATVGFNVTIEIVAKNWIDLTGGDDGISGIPPVSLGGFAFDTDTRFFYLAIGFLAVAALIGAAIRASGFGRMMIAVRDDELACGACSVPIFRIKLLAFILAAVFAAVSGALYASYANYIAPSDFDSVHAITLLVMLIVGGEASILGGIGGCILVSFGPELLRFLGEAYLTVFGALIIVMLVLMPNGIVGALASVRRRILA